MKKNILTSCLLVLFSLSAISQSKLELATVVENTDTETLRSLSEKFNIEFEEREARIKVYLENNPLKTKSFKVDGVFKEIYDVVDGEISYYSTSNLGSSITSRANKLYNNGGLGLNIQGQGMYGFVWDGGSARTTHVQFPNNKVFAVDGGALSDHATHVMGTIVAQGVGSTNIRGNAFDASASSYKWDNDYSEMALEASFGMLVSNHSYWIGTTVSEWSFGAYDYRASSFDQIAFAAPYYLAVTAAGNDRNDYSDAVIGAHLNSKFGYDLIRGMQNAKNYLTVGAVNQVLSYTGPSSVVMSSFSSWGPTDDGRIKPDVVTKGVSVNSTLDTSDTATGNMSGTSMASPGAAGVALLLQQYYNSLNSNFMRAATLKGLMMHSADEAGVANGPDYEYGWGLINAEKAVNIIMQDNLEIGTIQENVLQNNQSFTLPITSSGSEPLFVSISWTDRAATANTNNSIDPTTLYLVNDLDLRVTNAATTYFPWTLDPATPFLGAVNTADNFRDNFEKVQINNPSGNYLVTVSHKGTLVGGSQNFSLIVSSQNGVVLNKYNFNADDVISIYPNPTSDFINIQSSLDLGKAKVELFDMLGKKIITNEFVNNSLDITSLVDGVYMINVSIDGQTYVKKIVKK